MSENNLPKIISFYSNKSKHKTVKKFNEKIGSERIKLIKFIRKNLNMKNMVIVVMVIMEMIS